LPHTAPSDALSDVGRRYINLRDKLRLSRGLSLTDIYNRLHNPLDSDSAISDFRNVHIELDLVVASSYGWYDINITHDFYETKQGMRFTLSEALRKNVLSRLLTLNYLKHSEEADLIQKDRMPAIKQKRNDGPKDNTDQITLDL
jgi:hypothetical protein